MPSFDVISKINHQEFDNALSNCLREISNRFDFKGLHISIDRKDKLITTIAPDELKLRQVNELLQTHLIRRKVDPRVVSMKSSESASGGSIRQISELKEGISQENAKKVIADIKKLKQVNELLQTHLVRRKVDPRVSEVKSSEGASGGSIRQVSELKEGISQENAKKVIADIKKLKLKIQIKIQGDELRVDGKKKDELQEAISAIKSIDIGLPIEFVNFRD